MTRRCKRDRSRRVARGRDRRPGSMYPSAKALGGGGVRVLGYSFRQAGDAARARRVLTQLYGLRPGDARLADLADDGIVLGIRAREDNVDDVARVLAEHGGEPLVDIDERWTGIRPDGN